MHCGTTYYYLKKKEEQHTVAHPSQTLGDKRVRISKRGVFTLKALASIHTDRPPLTIKIAIRRSPSIVSSTCHRDIFVADKLQNVEYRQSYCMESYDYIPQLQEP